MHKIRLNEATYYCVSKLAFMITKRIEFVCMIGLLSINKAGIVHKEGSSVLTYSFKCQSNKCSIICEYDKMF